MSYRDTLAGLLSRTKDPERRAQLESELVSPPCPPALAYLWRCYGRIRSRKGASGFGIGPLEWPDIDAFNRLSGARLAPWEVEILEAVDDLYLRAQLGKNDPPSPE